MDVAHLTVISDLHLSAGPAKRVVRDEDVAGFLDDVGSRARGEEAEHGLLLLGDLLDLAHVRGVQEAVAEVDRIAGGHPQTFAALARLTAAGVRVGVVAGNHDMALMHRTVRQRLERLLIEIGGRPRAAEGLRFYPWIVHVPGRFYAEHGQQQHDLNRFPDLLEPYLDSSSPALFTTPGACLEEARGTRPAVAGVRLAASLGGLSRGERPRRRAAHERRIESLAPDIGLDAGVLVALDREAAATPRTIATRALRQATGRCDRHYMLRAARVIHARLAERGMQAPAYVFAHTHAPADQPLLADREIPRYLNPGSWALSYPPTPAPSRDRLPFVELAADRPGGRLLAWDAVRGCRVPPGSAA